MGHTINPITWRVGSLFHWNFNFFSKRLNYFYLTLKLNNLLIVLLRYLKYLRIKFLKNFNFNFSSCRICILNKKFVILIRSKINFIRRKVYVNRGRLRSLYFWNFTKTYNANWIEYRRAIIKFRENISSSLHFYFFLLKIPQDYRFFYLKKLKKKFRQKRKNLKQAVEEAKVIYDDFEKSRIFFRFRKRLNQLKAITCTKKNLNYFFYLPKISNKITFIRYTKKPLIKSFWDKFILILLRKLVTFFYLIPLMNYFKKLLYWKAYQLDKKIFNNLEIYFLFDKKFFLNSYTLVYYLLRKFSKRRLRTRRTINRVVKYLDHKIKMNRIKGYKFLITGRLTKKDRVTCILEKRGLTKIGKKYLRIDYYEDLFITKFSIGIMKVWLFF